MVSCSLLFVGCLVCRVLCYLQVLPDDAFLETQIMQTDSIERNTEVKSSSHKLKVKRRSVQVKGKLKLKVHTPLVAQ